MYTVGWAIGFGLGTVYAVTASSNARSRFILLLRLHNYYNLFFFLLFLLLEKFNSLGKDFFF